MAEKKDPMDNPAWIQAVEALLAKYPDCGTMKEFNQILATQPRELNPTLLDIRGALGMMGIPKEEYTAIGKLLTHSAKVPKKKEVPTNPREKIPRKPRKISHEYRFNDEQKEKLNKIWGEIKTVFSRYKHVWPFVLKSLRNPESYIGLEKERLLSGSDKYFDQAVENLHNYLEHPERPSTQYQGSMDCFVPANAETIERFDGLCEQIRQIRQQAQRTSLGAEGNRGNEEPQPQR